MLELKVLPTHPDSIPEEEEDDEDSLDRLDQEDDGEGVQVSLAQASHTA
jgi:hypothetical protein